MNQEEKKRLEEYLDILTSEICSADWSYLILLTIANNWGKLSKNNIRIFFESLYSSYFIVYTISLTKLYDNPHQKYEVVSLPTVLTHIENASPNQDKINKKYLDDIISDFTKKMPSSNISDNSELSGILRTLKTYRNKIYTHPEFVNPISLPKTTLENSQKLLDFAKDFVTNFGLVLEMPHPVKGLGSLCLIKAQQINNIFLDLLKKSGIITVSGEVEEH